MAYRPRIGRSKVTGTVRGTARASRDMARLLRETGSDMKILVVAKSPGAGPGQDPAVPAAHAAAGGRRRGRGPARHARPRRRPAAPTTCVLALDGEPGPLAARGWRVVAAARRRRSPSGSPRRGTDCGGPTLQIGMDTPQVTTPAARRMRWPSSRRTDCVLGPATDGGWWALGLRAPQPTAFDGVPMSAARHLRSTSVRRLRGARRWARRCSRRSPTSTRGRTRVAVARASSRRPVRGGRRLATRHPAPRPPAAVASMRVAGHRRRRLHRLARRRPARRTTATTWCPSTPSPRPRTRRRPTT